MTGMWSTIPWPPAGGPYAPVLTTSNLETFQPVGAKRTNPYDADAFLAQWGKRLKQLDFPDPSPSSDPIVISSDDDDYDSDDSSSSASMNVPAGPSKTPTLSPEQEEVVALAARGFNIFYTGSAGCGKSTVLHAIKRRLREMGKNVYVVAPTGMAALAIGGTTTWRYAGWSPDSLRKPLKALQMIPLAHHDERIKERLQRTDVLIIDEISMIENLFFERLSEVLKFVRGKDDSGEPFGGVQIIVTGDFCQLPPVKPFQTCLCGGDFINCDRETGLYICSKRMIGKGCEYGRSYNESERWAFQSRAWKACNFRHILLRTIYRQNDSRFVKMLQHCRTGRPLSQSDIDLLMTDRPVPKDAVRLFPRRHEVAELNRRQFALLPDHPRPYPCLDSFLPSEKVNETDRQKNMERKEPDPLLRNARTLAPLCALTDHRFDELVSLKTGMLVVLLANLDLENRLCNGSQGVIIGFEPFHPANLPTRKAGQLAGEHARLKESEIIAFARQAERYHSFNCPLPFGWPRVRFHDGQTRTIYPECQVSEVGDEPPYSSLSRTQLPLAPAWALSVHKAQGMTLDRVVVNLQNAFEAGQVYVALSRARTLEGLKVEGRIADLQTGLAVNEEVQRVLEEWFAGQENRPGQGAGVAGEEEDSWYGDSEAEGYF